MKKLIAIAALSILSFSQTAQAALSVGRYKEVKDTSAFGTYWTGFLSGLLWSNSALVSRNLPPLYCQPPKLALTVDNSIHILDNFLKEHEKHEDDPDVEATMILALQEAFPCQSHKTEGTK